jgi:hypothetical protein
MFLLENKNKTPQQRFNVNIIYILHITTTKIRVINNLHND